MVAAGQLQGEHRAIAVSDFFWGIFVIPIALQFEAGA